MSGNADTSGDPDGRVPFARLSWPRVAEPTRLAVLSDPHFTTVESGTSKQLHRTEDRLRAAIEDVNRREVDAALFLGDLVQRGRRSEFDELASRLARLDPPAYAVPGNHDLACYDRVEGLSIEEFAERFAPGSYPFARSIGDVRLIGLPAIGREVDPGNVDRVLRPSKPGTTILCLHYPLPAAVDQLEEADLPGAFVRSAVCGHGLYERLPDRTLVLSGHLHLPLAARTDSHAEVVAPPLCTYPQGYLLLAAGPEGCEIDFVPVADADTLSRARRARARHSETDRLLTAVAREALRSFPLLERTPPAGGDDPPPTSPGDERSPQ